MEKFLNFRNLKLTLLVGFETIKRNKLVLGISALVLIILLTAQFKFNLFFNSNSITLGLIGTYQTHDLPEEVTKLISQGLVVEDQGGRIKGNLVTGWETNNDATDFKFQLKDNLKWIDGSPIKASDLEFSIPNVDVSTPDDKTIEFKLKESYSPLPSLLTKPVIKKGSMIGIGPYKITRIDKSRIFITKIELKPSNPGLPSVNIRFYPNEKVAITGFNLGEIQSLLGFSSLKLLSGSNIGFLQKDDHTKIVSILFQTKDAFLSNRSLRQALAYITPKIAGEEVADNPYPHNFWAYDDSSKKYLDNPDEAKSAMDRAKASMPDDKLKGELILTATPNLEGVGTQVISAWKSLGFDAKIRIESGIAQNFQALLITQSIPIDPDQYVLWHATQEKTNLSKYDSKRVDKDLEDGRKTITEDDRKLKYFDFQKTLLEDTPAVFLYFPKYNIAYLKKKEAILQRVLSI